MMHPIHLPAATAFIMIVAATTLSRSARAFAPRRYHLAPRFSAPDAKAYVSTTANGEQDTDTSTGIGGGNTSNSSCTCTPITNEVSLAKVCESSLSPESLPPVKVHVIAHRGASGTVPDHTLESYRAAFLEGADFIELDVQCSSDGHLVINHDIDLGDTTDVSDWDWARPLRRRIKAPSEDGESGVMEGWMVCHFTLEQIKELRVRRSDKFDNRSKEHDMKYEIPTLAETCDFVQTKLVDNEKCTRTDQCMTKQEWLEHRNRYMLKFGRCRPNPNVGLYIETKRPAWYRSIGLPIEEKLVKTLDASKFEGPVIIQSFEKDSLARMQELKPNWLQVKLLTKQDIDIAIENECLDKMMEELASLGVDGIGPDKASILADPTNPPETSPVVEAAHKHGLIVHPYTFRSDVTRLHRIYGGNASQEFAQFFRLGVDGVFADFPGHGVFARELYNRLRLKGSDFLLYSDMTDED